MKYNNIIAYTKESKNISPIPMPCWTYPKDVYDALKVMYPTSFDKNNRTWLLEIAIVDKFLIGKLEIQLAHNFIMGLAGKNRQYSGELIEDARLNLNGLFELHNYSDELEEKLLADHYSEHELEYGTGWVNFGQTYRRVRGKGAGDIGGSRLGLYVPNAQFEIVKEEYINTRYVDSIRVFVLTGNKNTRKSRRTVENLLKEYAKNLTTYYKKKGTLPGMLELTETVNKLVNNKARTQLINQNAPVVLEDLVICRDTNTGVCEDLNDNEEKITMLYNHHKSSVERLMDTPIDVYRLPKPGSPRIFDGLDQALAKEVREKIFPKDANCVDLDLARSQLVIIASLSGDAELAEWAVKTDIWEDIWLSTGISKWIAKPCLYTYCFGGNANTWYKEDYIQKEYAEELKAHPLYVALARAGSLLRTKALKDGYVMMASHKLELNADISPRSAVACQVQYIESMIIKSVVDYISQHQDKINLMGVYHDGVLCKFKNRYKPRKYVQEMNEIVKTTAQYFGIDNVKLDIKL